MATSILSILTVIFATIIGAFGAIFLKKASANFALKFSFLFNRNFLLGILFYSISTTIYLVALKFGELSILFPTVSTIYIWVSIFSQKFLNERMNKLKWLGIFIIILGVVLLAVGAR
ncbi:MAG: EamA family transporter [Nanoarchaeota archaeon]|mgnify:CR=1 FL=1